jgi:hypothetical protein
MIKSKYWRVEAARAVSGPVGNLPIDSVPSEVFRRELCFPIPMRERQVIAYLDAEESRPWYVVAICALRSWKCNYRYAGGSGYTVLFLPLSLSVESSRTQIRAWVRYKFLAVRQVAGFHITGIEREQE